MSVLKCRSPALALALLHLAGCVRSWEAVTASPAEAIESQRPAVIRLTLADAQQIVARHPSIRGDSIHCVVRELRPDAAQQNRNPSDGAGLQTYAKRRAIC